MGLINAYKPQLGISTCVCVCVCVCVYAFIAFCGYCNKTYLVTSISMALFLDIL